MAVVGDLSESPKSVLIHTSGVHGAEGFAGSAIQIDFLSRLASENKLKDRIDKLEGVKIILVHAGRK